MGERSTSELAEKLSIRIRVCLQAPEFAESSRFVSGYAFRLPNLRKALGSYQGMPSGSRICGKLSIRIRVCLQAYRNSMKNSPALAAGARCCNHKKHFSVARAGGSRVTPRNKGCCH